MSDIREYFKRWPNLYFFIATVFGPLMFTGLSGKKFLAKYPMEGVTLNLGSGPRIIGEGVTNVDIHAYPGVSIVADASAVPLEAGTVSRIVFDNVLEHVPEPQASVAEIQRLLKQGGVAYIAIPFLYPYHSSPNDYQRYTKEGIKELFKDFEMIEVGVRAGPFSALNTYACHLVGLIFSFGSPFLNSLFTNLSMFLLFPIKLLDLIFNHWPEAHTMAAVLYCVVRKK